MVSVVVDANLLLLLIVGSADERHISAYKNLSQFNMADFDILVQAISLYSEIVLLPHVMAEVSSLARQIKNPARTRIQSKMAELVETVGEISIPSLDGVRRAEFDMLGLTDSVMLHLCMLTRSGAGFALLTADNDLAIRAEMAGCDVLNFMHLR